MSKAIKHTWFFSQRPAQVWEYLTNSELLAQWLMPNNFKLEKGHEFEFRTKPMPALNLDGIFRCKVLEIDPLKRLVYSWQGGPDASNIVFDTIVEWTLTEKDKGTELLLLHKGFKEQNEEIFIGMSKGWPEKIEKMLSLLKA